MSIRKCPSAIVWSANARPQMSFRKWRSANVATPYQTTNPSKKEGRIRGLCPKRQNTHSFCAINQSFMPRNLSFRYRQTTIQFYSISRYYYYILYSLGTTATATIILQKRRKLRVYCRHNLQQSKRVWMSTAKFFDKSGQSVGKLAGVSSPQHFPLPQFPNLLGTYLILYI